MSALSADLDSSQTKEEVISRVKCGQCVLLLSCHWKVFVLLFALELIEGKHSSRNDHIE